jgi:hypothetical protein
MTVVTGTMARVRGRRVAFVDARTLAARPREVVRRPAKVERMLALAHHIQGAIERGVVADRVVVARQLRLTRARVTQLLDLTLLAPDIQEAVLGLEAVDGVEPMFEGVLRRVLKSVDGVGRTEGDLGWGGAVTEPSSRRNGQFRASGHP